jgi:hypothetical protein
MTDTDKEQFELERLDSMRTFEIVFANPTTGAITTETFFAHFHQTTDAGDLFLLVIQPDGQQLIAHLFNARSWVRLTEIGHSQKNTPHSTKVH